jgi:hypothetical protein
MFGYQLPRRDLTYDRKPKIAPEIISAIHAEGLRRRKAAASQ